MLYPLLCLPLSLGVGIFYPSNEKLPMKTSSIIKLERQNREHGRVIDAYSQGMDDDTDNDTVWMGYDYGNVAFNMWPEGLKNKYLGLKKV